MTLRPLLAYAPWHLRDVAVKAISPVLLFAVMVAFPLAAVYSGADTAGGPVSWTDSPSMRDFASQVYGSMLGLTVLIGGLLAMNATLSTDREKQHVRFLFSHPVSPVAFYLQRYLVGVAATSLAYLLVPIGYSAIILDVSVLGAFQAMLLACLVYGAITMLAGAMTAKDGVLVIAVFVVASVTQQVAASDRAPRWMEIIAAMLPPVHHVSEHIRAFTTGASSDAMPLWGIGLWTVGMLAAALVLVRRGPLVR